MMRILEAQRIVSIDTLFEMADHLDSLAKGEKVNTALLNRLAAPHLRNPASPRFPDGGSRRTPCRSDIGPSGTSRPQRKLNLRAIIDKAADKERLKDTRGAAGAVPARYAGGLQLRALRAAGRADPVHQSGIRAQPRFHRRAGTRADLESHRDVRHGMAVERRRTAGGSLSGLPYALAEAEQNFLVPTQTQALIWGDLVPQMILSAKIPRWWNVTPGRRCTGWSCTCSLAAICWRKAALDPARAAAGARHARAAGNPLPHQRSRQAAAAGRGEGCAGESHAVGTVRAGP